ncbi:MAG: AmmeMemoRadiSam system radical SAM enzyme [Tepidisphaerales bacterium]
MPLPVLSDKDKLLSVKRVLSQHTAPAAPELIRKHDNGDIECLACGHTCLVKPGRDGVCRVRFNDEGTLRVPFGYVAGLNCDPIEKKPFYHLLSGSDCLTFGMLGCDYHCGYCQNWVTSQMLRDPTASANATLVTPEQIVAAALQHQAPVIASSYNEPLITSEWSVAVFKVARQSGLRCAYISNGNATPQVLDYIRPHLDGYKIDLKSFDDKHYRQLGGVLDHVLNTIRMVKERGLWLEIVTLLVPGFNDNPDELRRMTDFIASVDPLIPWHVTAFHPDYKMTDGYRRTSNSDLLKAVDIARAAGLRYIYPGNLPGQVGDYENTRCHHCSALLVSRHGFLVQQTRMKADGLCPDCGRPIPGIWGTPSGHRDGMIRRIA